MNLEKLKTHSYTPYSNNESVAAVRSTTAKWYPGVRVENISYPLSISAVQNALFCCLSEGDQPDVLFTNRTDHPQNTFWQHEYGVGVHSLTEANPSFQKLSLSTDIDIVKHLEQLLGQAQVTESNFPVSSIVETESGWYGGVNIECSSWNMGLCAERIAIAKALSYGATKFKRLHIHTKEGEFGSPCGACRQVIIEHLPQRQIHLYHADHSESVHFSNDLLPHSFQSSSLANN
jgi:homotetrameric cytidine deaminase